MEGFAPIALGRELLSEMEALHWMYSPAQGPRQMPTLLIVEDTPKDARLAANLAQQAGFSAIQALTSSKLAEVRLANTIEDMAALPDAIVLDLDLGVESGFEVLRFCHRNRLMQQIPVIVWSVMGEHESDICGLFGVREFVSKQDGPAALLEALTRVNRNVSGLGAAG